jgi:hypothetical protein
VRQHRVDSILETSTSVVVGFVVAMLTYRYIISPLYGFGSNTGESAGVVAIFTASSMIRQYLVRRVFDGKTIYEGLRALLRERKERHGH